MGLTPPIQISDEARANAPISATTIVGVSILYLALTTGFTGTRLYTRYTIYQQFWWDDCKFLSPSFYFPGEEYVSWSSREFSQSSNS